MSRFLVDLADVLRGAGVTVVEVDGWQTRARGSGGYEDGRPFCVAWHHTASRASADDDVAYIAWGSPDAPLANLYIDRDGVVFVIAAGATNTNGKGYAMQFSRGTVPDDQMNTHAVGIEIANDGVGEVYPAAQIEAAFAASLAVASTCDLEPTDVTTHQAYAPDRKIDPATADAATGFWPRAVNSSGSWNLDDLRAALRARTEPPEEGDDVTEDDVQRIALAVWDTRMQLADGTSSGTLLVVAGSPLSDEDVQRIALAVWDTPMMFADGTSSGTLLTMIDDILARVNALGA